MINTSGQPPNNWRNSAAFCLKANQSKKIPGFWSQMASHWPISRASWRSCSVVRGLATINSSSRLRLRIVSRGRLFSRAKFSIQATAAAGLSKLNSSAVNNRDERQRTSSSITSGCTMSPPLSASVLAREAGLFFSFTTDLLDDPQGVVARDQGNVLVAAEIFEQRQQLLRIG